MVGPSVEEKTGIVAISGNGARLGGIVAGSLPGDTVLHVAEGHLQSARVAEGVCVQAFPLPLRPVLGELFSRYARLVLFMPVGAAVRLLAPLLQHKHNDPAVACVDDAGRFVVSLLSGHVGGADRLAHEVAAVLGAQPVITSASHVLDTLAVDMLGREYGWRIEADSTTVTRVSASVVNGESVAVCQLAGERDWWPADRPLPANIQLFQRLEEALDSGCASLLLITDEADVPARSVLTPGGERQPAGGVIVYRPRSLVVGMGCRRGVERQHLQDLLESTFASHNLSTGSIKYIATASVKQDEQGLLELAERYSVPLVCYEVEELNGVFEALGCPERTTRRDSSGEPETASHPAGGLNPSSAARRLLGVWGVSEPAALLASGGTELLVSKVKTDRATIAVARIPFET